MIVIQYEKLLLESGVAKIVTKSHCGHGHKHKAVKPKLSSEAASRLMVGNVKGSLILQNFAFGISR